MRMCEYLPLYYLLGKGTEWTSSCRNKFCKRLQNYGDTLAMKAVCNGHLMRYLLFSEHDNRVREERGEKGTFQADVY